ncbi:TetR/AcrR family transcriptional regulator [Streptomyces sp. ID05-39B]|uniref:TetR/AcrR family transcriptional regulator n=1 Tax=Streptomyces sp. ID05-39B TaxID=3028664 RepID=UPI0029A708F2|nr:TetR/AcrR family transcriptional regulator [Streptomyces sp. ID05-39B]MDX3526723.1 TetR/AcrR family transcriptional regulator [Streptomyces sp. ID05-39B]
MPDDRAGHILDSALTVFRQYGYAKTTMQDIARAAGMSRAALYLHFAGKEELFRAGSRRAHSRALELVDASLAEEGDVLSMIDTAIAAYFTELTAQISSSAHGGELFDATHTITEDIVGEARTALVARLTVALEEAAEAGDVRFAAVDTTAEDLALLLLSVMDGLKNTSPDPAVRHERRTLFLRLTRAALTSPGETGD